jgi:hypothetical protein
MDKLQCEQLLHNQYKQNGEKSPSISKLTSEARGTQKSDCTTQLGWFASIQKMITEDTRQTTVQHSAAATPVATTSTPWEQYGILGLEIIIGLVALILVGKCLTRAIELIYDIANAHNIIYMKIMLPRGEGKVDREENKEIAKDMKEKIGRMGQVFANLSKLGSLNTWDGLQNLIFKKPKISFMYHYEDGKLFFYVATYNEYTHIIESAVSSQYADVSIEISEKPKIFDKKFTEVMPLESEKENIYTIKMFKHAADDQINNIIDAISSISIYDKVSIVMNIKPVSESRNDKAKKDINRLYKNLELEKPRWYKLFMPRLLLKFLFKWPSDKPNEENVTMVRMVKAQEDTLNAMGEEAGNPAFKTGLYIVVGSDDSIRAREWLESILSAYSVYADEYGNELHHPENKSDIFGFFYKPIWKWCVQFHLVAMGAIKNVFSTNELSSLFHFPARVYNRSEAIQWMPFKVLPAPDNLPQFTEENGYVLSGMVAEAYKGGDLSNILHEDKYDTHRAVGEKKTREEKLVDLEHIPADKRASVTVIEKDGKKMAKATVEKKVKWFKLYKDWVFLGINNYRNTLSPIYIKRNDRTRHHYMIGKSGTGKSVFLDMLARQDAWNGDGFCLIDPHGDLAESVLEYIPKERAKDVIYFDAGNEDRPMWLNLYEIDHIDQADRTVNDATEIFLKMFGPEIFGPRIQEYFKYGSLTLMEDFDDKPTLLDVPRLFTDDAYREYKIKKVQNPVVKNFREKTYNAMGDREKQEIIPYFTSKFVSFNTNRLIRNIIGQTHSAFDFADVMNNKKILLISLSKGKIGELNAQLLGMIIVSKIYNAAMARARIPEEERKDFYLYVDEFQNFISGTFADILSEARKYRLSLIMAHQYIAQLEWGWGNNIWQDKWGKSDVKAAVFGNVGTMMSFKVGAPDAEFLEKEYVPTLWAWDIVGIANYKSYIKLNIDNSTSRPFSMNMLYSKDYRNKKVAWVLKEYSAKKYGRKREFIDAEISARLGLWVDEKTLPSTDVQSAPAADTSTTTPTPPSTENPTAPAKTE